MPGGHLDLSAPADWLDAEDPLETMEKLSRLQAQRARGALLPLPPAPGSRPARARTVARLALLGAERKQETVTSRTAQLVFRRASCTK